MGIFFSLNFWMNWSIWSTFSIFSKILTKTCRTAEPPPPLCRIFYKKYTDNFWNRPLVEGTLAWPIRRHSGSTNAEDFWLYQAGGTLAQPIRRPNSLTNQEALVEFRKTTEDRAAPTSSLSCVLITTKFWYDPNKTK